MNKKLITWVVVVTLATLVIVGILLWQGEISIPDTRFVNGYSASRPADKGCMWAKQYRNTELGIEFVYEQCVDAHNKPIEISFTQAGNKITSIVDQIKDPVLEVFHKSPEQTIEQAILMVAGKNFTPYQKLHCIIADPIHDSPDQGSSFFVDKTKMVYIVTADEVYAKKLDAEKQYPSDMPEFGCGEYGDSDGVSYFEFHPNESKSTFIFSIPKSDVPYYDDKSIHFTK